MIEQIILGGTITVCGFCVISATGMIDLDLDKKTVNPKPRKIIKPNEVPYITLSKSLSKLGCKSKIERTYKHLRPIKKQEILMINSEASWTWQMNDGTSIRCERWFKGDEIKLYVYKFPKE